MRAARRIVALAAVVGALSVPATAGATIVKIRTGTYTSATTGSVTLPLGAASVSGTLLVAVLTNGNTAAQATFTGPTGWTFGIQTYQSCCGEVEVWYYADNPGGISSATFTASTGTQYLAGQLSEWNGVVASSPLDQTGTATHATATSQAVSTSGILTASGELGVTIFNTSLTGLTSFTVGTGWTHLFTDPTVNGDVSDSRIGLASGATATETEKVSGGSPSWLAAIATFEAATCSGGSLTMGTPASVAFPSVKLNGTDKTATATVALTPNDLTGGGAGWNITGTSTTFTNASSETLSTSATSVTAAATPTTGGNCVVPTNSITYPLTLPAAASAPTAVKLYNADAGTGEGPVNLNLTAKLAVPADAYNGAYTSTWTIAIASGP